MLVMQARPPVSRKSSQGGEAGGGRVENVARGREGGAGGCDGEGGEGREELVRDGLKEKVGDLKGRWGLGEGGGPGSFGRGKRGCRWNWSRASGTMNREAVQREIW